MRPNKFQKDYLDQFYAAVKRRFGDFGTWDCEVDNTDIIIKVHVSFNGGVDLLHYQDWRALVHESATPERLGGLVGSKLRRQLSKALQQARGIER